MKTSLVGRTNTICMQYNTEDFCKSEKNSASQVYMRASYISQRHSHLLSDLGPELPLLGLAGAVLFITTLAVYLYAATMR